MNKFYEIKNINKSQQIKMKEKNEFHKIDF